MKTGLTLGKFAPLHQGHQFLIEKGIAETDKLVVIIYDAPNETPVPLSVRADWIRMLYPCVEVLEAWDGPTEIGDTPEITNRHDQYILEILGDRKITHFFSSEFYGKHVSSALNAIDRRVDPGRSTIPVSGTEIRSNPFENRHLVDTRVYRDLTSWAVFLGAPSTGKTTLCQTLARKHETVWMPEYGRDYWEKNQKNRRLSQEQLLEIATEHRIREDLLAAEANDIFFVDTDATTTRIFSEHYHGETDPRLDALADQTIRRYDLFFLCDDDIPFADTWDRSGEGNRAVFQKKIRGDLLQRRIPFVTLRGTLDERVQTASYTLANFEKWTSQPDRLIGQCNQQITEHDAYRNKH